MSGLYCGLMQTYALILKKRCRREAPATPDSDGNLMLLCRHNKQGRAYLTKKAHLDAHEDVYICPSLKYRVVRLSTCGAVKSMGMAKIVVP